MEIPRFVITVGRQFGSGGRDLGKRLAELFGIAYYDKQLIAEVAKESGLAIEYIEKADEKVPNTMMRAVAANLAMGGVFNTGSTLSNENIFKFQSDVIQELVKNQSCVIVGRTADYILRDHPLVISVFVCASDEDRIQRILDKEPDIKTPKEALEMMRKIDKRRAEYYNFYTDRAWGEAGSYDLCIDSSKLGMDRTAEVVRDYVEMRIEEEEAADEDFPEGPELK